MKVLNTLIYTLVSGLLSLQASAVNYPWPQPAATGSPTFYYYNQKPLQEVILKVTQSYGVTVEFSPSLAKHILSTKVSGNFKVTGVAELLDTLGSIYGFSWFYYNNVVHIGSNQMIAQSVPIAADSMMSVKNILMSEGILDPKFGWSEATTEGLVVVSGPKEYIQLVAKRVDQLKISPIGQQFAVFRLKYASAVDTIVNLNNDRIVLPGVATILKTLLQGPQNTTPGVNNKMLQQVIEPLKNNFKAMLPADMGGDKIPPPFDQPAANGAPSNTASEDRQRSTVSAAVIQADERLNTIIIRDKASNLPIYRSLIDMLDVPAPLIQVEVMIVDIDQVKINQAGINWWGSTGTGFGGGFGSGNLSSLNQPSSTSTLALAYGNVSPGSLVVSNIKSFLTGLQFLEQNGYAKTQSKSAVITIDNIAAIVNLSQSFYAQTQPTSAGNNLAPVQTNMVMQVTPHLIIDNGGQKRIKLVVALQDGNVEDKMINGLPTTMQGNLNSQAVIDNQNSLLLAGFTRSQMVQSESKVPLLGDIPLIGWLFKQSSSQLKQMQRFYLVTPHLIWDDRNLAIPGYSVADVKEKKLEEKPEIMKPGEGTQAQFLNAPQPSVTPQSTVEPTKQLEETQTNVVPDQSVSMTQPEAPAVQPEPQLTPLPAGEPAPAVLPQNSLPVENITSRPEPTIEPPSEATPPPPAELSP